jgi:hypothetical protein
LAKCGRFRNGEKCPLDFEETIFERLLISGGRNCPRKPRPYFLFKME